ncbi:MAG: hypothetical protein HC835_04735 [Oscillatoriales cyanobacterium RM2_1_1]|nr:hypothetical protein [Oscillatoriales cyanobacterium RM2_1_1]
MYQPDFPRSQPFPDQITRWLKASEVNSISKNLDAVVLWTNGKALFFKGDICLRYDINTHSIDPGYPQKIAEGEWSILPESFLQGIDAGLVWNNGKAFFFRENEYIMIDLYKRQIEPGYPQKLDSGQWIGWPSHFYQGIDTAVLWDHGKAYFLRGANIFATTFIGRWWMLAILKRLLVFPGRAYPTTSQRILMPL